MIPENPKPERMTHAEQQNSRWSDLRSLLQHAGNGTKKISGHCWGAEMPLKNERNGSNQPGLALRVRRQYPGCLASERPALDEAVDDRANAVPQTCDFADHDNDFWGKAGNQHSDSGA